MKSYDFERTEMMKSSNHQIAGFVENLRVRRFSNYLLPRAEKDHDVNSRLFALG